MLPADIHQCIGTDCLLETDLSITMLLGVAGCKLKKLLHDVQSPFGCKQPSCMSTKSMQMYVGDLTVGHHQTSDVAQQSPLTGPYIQVVTIRCPPLDVAWGSLNLHLMLNVMASPDAIHVSCSVS